MSERQAYIQDCVSALTPAAPKIVTYHNGTLVAMRNGDGLRVATIIEHTLKPEEIKHRLNQLFKVRTENQPSPETLARLHDF